ncbi:2455_t:CDS:1 [Ambispora gerdemannii]|uniref:2455_t:CDS:1 n=1 Tax=Ambispora gerdemannii TaxID=144530 RepID=A0A9N8VCY1_9GLOM|nr:2455_t:CDS:1 [Ambispora gerdemannii]
MMLKSTTLTSLVTLSLLVIFLTFSHATPVPCSPVGVAKFDILGGQIKFTQVDATNVQIEGQLTRGITDTNAELYHALIGNSIDLTFAQLCVVITPPGTNPFKSVIPGNVTSLIDQTLTITKRDIIDVTLDSALIESEQLGKAKRRIIA